jgi:hypothetical protein
MSEPIKLPPVPAHPIVRSQHRGVTIPGNGWSESEVAIIRAYARLAVEQNTEALRAERDALQQIVADYPPIEAELREVSDRAFQAEAERDKLRAKLARYETLRPASEHTCGAAIWWYHSWGGRLCPSLLPPTYPVPVGWTPLPDVKEATK